MISRTTAQSLNTQHHPASHFLMLDELHGQQGAPPLSEPLANRESHQVRQLAPAQAHNLQDGVRVGRLALDLDSHDAKQHDLRENRLMHLVSIHICMPLLLRPQQMRDREQLYWLGGGDKQALLITSKPLIDEKVHAATGAHLERRTSGVPERTAYPIVPADGRRIFDIQTLKCSEHAEVGITQSAVQAGAHHATVDDCKSVIDQVQWLTTSTAGHHTAQVSPSASGLVVRFPDSAEPERASRPYLR